MHPFWRELLDLVYPPRCQVCREFSADPLCQKCRQEIIAIDLPVCTQCGAPLDPKARGADTCQPCRVRKRNPIDWSRAPALYDGALARAIQQFKFEGRRALAIPLAKMLASLEARGLAEAAPVDCCCPVPLHRQRLKERGYNQSELLAKYYAQEKGVSMRTDILTRTRPTLPQVMLPADKRRANVRGAFAIRAGADIKGKRVLLIDDVYTTGATLQECARALRRGGAAAVYVITVALPKPKWMVAEQT